MSTSMTRVYDTYYRTAASGRIRKRRGAGQRLRIESVVLY